MSKKYSQFKAALVLSKASLIATLRSPTSIVFALLFPIIFVTVFGAMVDNTAVKVKIVLSPHSDSSSPMYAAVKAISIFDLSYGKDSAAMLADLKREELRASYTCIRRPSSTAYHILAPTCWAAAQWPISCR